MNASARQRELRTRIGRSRRRIDRRLRAIGNEGKRLLSWRTHVQRHPLGAVAAALSAGLAAAAALGSRRLRDRLGREILPLIFRSLGGALAKEVLRQFRSGGNKP
ncbi:MAG: hypothetical protein JXB10_09000 [Pirellulales bacterium]|nr:hypothetical protein [Pirellulales bacterium]